MTKARLTVVAALLIPLVWLLGPALFSSQSFVYRDAAHYYYPLFHFVQSQWDQGRLPLWNHLDGIGQPLLADNTASVLYPGKLVFALPLGFAARYKLYVIAHLGLAACCAYFVTRRWGASDLGAALAGLAYAFGGNVLFQYCNIVFLVGAAWLPLACWTTDRMLVERRAIWAVALGATLAMMTLGGDPQTAYHVGLAGGLYGLILWQRERGHREAEADLFLGPKQDQPVIRRIAGRAPSPALPRLMNTFRPLATRRLVLLSLAGVAGATLAAVQIVPTMQWVRHSHRAAFQLPRNVYEGAIVLARSLDGDLHESENTSAPQHEGWDQVAAGWFGRPRPGSHHEHIYRFSVGPWRLPELLWPNFGGRPFPVHRRWLHVVPAEGRAWTPSLYMGLLPILLACAALRLRRAPARVQWLSWIVVLSICGGFGWYGVGWLVNELRHVLWPNAIGDAAMGPPVGGLYWMLVVLLPGYAQFRYPAKLWVMAAWALSALAARGWDAAWSEKATPPRRLLLVTCVVSTLAVASMVIGRSAWQEGMQHVSPDELFGPLDAAGARRDLIWSLGQTGLLSLVFWWLFAAAGTARWRRAAAGALLLTSLDLALAGSGLMAYAPEQMWQTPSRLDLAVGAAGPRDGAARHYRAFREASPSWLPEAWTRRSSPMRQREGLRWDRATLLPKYHLLEQVPLIESSSAFSSADYQALLAVARRYGPRRPDGAGQPHHSVLGALSSKYMIVPNDFPRGSLEPVEGGDGESARDKNITVLQNLEAHPKVWIVRDVTRLPPLRERRPTAIERRTSEVFFPAGRPRDLLQQAVVECQSLPAPVPPPSTAPVPARDQCQIVRHEPDMVEIEAWLTHPGLVVLNDLYYPGWVASIETEGRGGSVLAPILRTNRVMRGVYLGAGRHRLLFRYRPSAFWIGLAISLMAWTGVTLGGICRSSSSGIHSVQTAWIPQ